MTVACKSQRDGEKGLGVSTVLFCVEADALSDVNKSLPSLNCTLVEGRNVQTIGLTCCFQFDS